VARWTVKEIAAIPAVSDAGPKDPTWYPLQHALGIDTFGANLFVATHADQTLVQDHDERASGQQELYIVLEGEVAFQLDGEEGRVGRGAAIAITDPSVRRRGSARSAGTALLIVGAGPDPFTSTWDSSHFSDIPRPE
jgi:quercetin dioxygenase-like cupin family protein